MNGQHHYLCFLVYRAYLYNNKKKYRTAQWRVDLQLPASELFQQDGPDFTE